MRLPDNRYEEIKQDVTTMFELCGERQIPIRPLSIAERLGIEAVPYSQLAEEGKAAALMLSEDGFSMRRETAWGTSGSIIYYNDVEYAGRIRFTILHELGHLVLGHTQSSDVAEAEADFFAKFAIAPPSLIHVIQPHDYLDIAATFACSCECAMNSWNYYRKWALAEHGSRYEQQLEHLFVIRDSKGGDAMLRMRKGA